MCAVHDGGIRASVEEQVQAADAVVLCRQVHGDRIDAMAFAAPVVAQIGSAPWSSNQVAASTLSL